MKKIIYSVIALGALVISSCSSDPCEGKSAVTLCSGNGTLAASGSNCACNCNAGFFGTKCDSSLKAVLIAKGTFINNTNSNSNPVPQVNSTISADPADLTSSTKIVILDLGAGYKSSGALVQTRADITNANTITLNEASQGGYVFKGSGVKQADGSWKFTYTTTYLTTGTTPTVDNNVTILR